MLEYKRILDENGLMRYEYYPNGDVNASGVVEFKNGEPVRVVQESSLDVKMYYAIHALHGIDTTKEYGTVAWN